MKIPASIPETISPGGGGGGGVLAPSLGTHCEPDSKSSGGESRDRRVVTAPYP